MKTLSMTLAALSLGGLCNLALAAGNPLSVHVLNLENGLPSAGVGVTLEQHVGDTWQPLSEGVTNQQGRIAELFPADRSMTPGEYRVVFKTGDYYKKANRETFFPQVPVIFQVKQADQHYHIPLLLSPYGFSTYRGS
ncbi:5-hydroxyisourate hydrolase precursor [Pseudomonas sp. 22 E 5]|jgi:5-hydroxyisourate hydrolase|uniref:5-hydroxyisourate hydrolase n=1 Tax=Pseudomonas fluorescens TaxID=294 RepID=A0A4Y9T8P3_PSEFL|nr:MULTISPECIES: hydroxyisourate hydrolase [Pseudomonas]CRM94611.1 5-hydroxyisourate hydrolase precursor [Pseudomonas sp. 22 E 5]MCX9153241.1 hydroxyisourate hydrolase [Pseudomonas sp. TB1-B1]TFW40654.1 hydroxyisourate hydrolase [Pseudomonas fluorescens]CRM01915.1 5-hydroxyisourate hydrolase precursor [Pseudomonas sp. 31 E 5]CRM11836.1 5-hydroxyisourate hydrolase precursor [Pseudomonas sp. 31 E 6]